MATKKTPPKPTKAKAPARKPTSIKEKSAEPTAKRKVVRTTKLGKVTKRGPAAAVPTVTQDQVAARAYILFERGGYHHGHDVENWLQAEAELVAELQTE